MQYSVEATAAVRWKKENGKSEPDIVQITFPDRRSHV
jgi:hypothetical protein